MSAGGGSRASSWEEHAGLRTDYQGIHQGVDASEESIGIGYGGLDDVGHNYGIGFGPGDLRMATEDNFSAGSILDYLNNTYTGVVPQSVRNTLINRRADENRERAQWQSDNQTWDMIGGAFDQFQETQQAWNQQQADAQAAANEQATAAQDATRAYQDQMLQAQRQVRTATALQVIARMSRLLDQQFVDTGDRWLVVDPVFIEVLKDEDSRLLNSDFGGSGLQNGLVVNNLHGFKIYVSNNLPQVGTGSGTTGASNQSSNFGVIVAGHGSAVATAQQVSKTESYRDPDSFADIVRGMHLYGRKILRPEAIVTANFNVA